MVRHADEFKIEVARQYLLRRIGARSLAAQYGLDHATVRRWAERYRQHGEAGLRKKFSHYSTRFKLSVLRRMWREELSCRQVAALFDLRGGHTVVTTWERQYHEGGLDALKPKPRGRPKTMPALKSLKPVQPDAEDTRPREALLEEVKYLRAEVAYLKKLRALRQEKERAAPKKRGSCSN